MTRSETVRAGKPPAQVEAKRFGKLQVLIARMNPDLAMGDELLKKSGTGSAASNSGARNGFRVSLSRR